MQAIVVVKKTARPGKFGRYVRVGVVMVKPGTDPDDIYALSERDKHVVRVVQTWERCSVGGVNSAASVAIVEASNLAFRLNGGIR
jgi:hypothetical protein